MSIAFVSIKFPLIKAARKALQSPMETCSNKDAQLSLNSELDNLAEVQKFSF